MKMTKIAFWRKVKENIERGLIVPCTGIFDADCPYDIGSKECCICGTGEGDNALKYAKAYIKRHESKSKKKDHILDTTKKVEEPKPIKTVGIDNSDVTLVLTAQHEPTPLQIAKMIRDNGYSCINLRQKNVFGCRAGCPLSNGGCGHSNDRLSEYMFEVRKKLIDDYISANEPVKDCHANSEIPQPVKLPDFVYSASKNGVGFIDTKNRTFNTNDKGELLLNDKPCFATPEEALQVAKKLWNGEGK